MFGPEVNLLLQQWSAPWLDRIMAAVGALGSAYGYMVLLPLFYWCVDRRRGLAYAFLVSAWLNGFLKEAVGLPRPSPLEGVRVLAFEYSNGFPSGHTQAAATFTGYLYRAYRHPALAALSLAAVALWAFERLYRGAHYLGDVVGGAALGWAMAGTWVWAEARGLGRRWGRGTRAALALGLPLLLLPLCGDRSAYPTLGFLMGFGASSAYAEEALPYSVRAPLRVQVLRALVGLGGFALLYALHGLLPRGLPELGGYALMGMWVAAGAPALFRRWGLAGSPQPPRAPARPLGVAALAGVLALAATVPLAGRVSLQGREGRLPVGAVGQEPGVRFGAAGAAGTPRAQVWALVVPRGGEGLQEAAARARQEGADGLVLEVGLSSLGEPEARATRGAAAAPLEEMLRRFPGTPLLLKLEEGDPRLARAVAEELKQTGAAGRVVVYAPEPLRRILEQQAPGVPALVSPPQAVRFLAAQRAGLWSFLPPPRGMALLLPERIGLLPAVTPGLVQAAHQRGLAVWAGPVEEARDMERLARYGVDALVTASPAQARRAVETAYALASRTRLTPSSHSTR